MINDQDREAMEKFINLVRKGYVRCVPPEGVECQSFLVTDKMADILQKFMDATRVN